MDYDSFYKPTDRLQAIAAILKFDLDDPPKSGLSSTIYGWQHARGPWLDVHLVEAMLDMHPDGVWSVEVGDTIGIGGRRAAGRFRSMEQRGIVKKAPTDTPSYFIEGCEYPKSSRGGAWCLTAASERRLIGARS